MMFNSLSLTSSLLLLGASLVSVSAAPSSKVTTKDIYQFPNTTWLENLAIRSNGEILTGVISRPELWSVDPAQHPAKAHLVHNFTEVNSVFGITEVGEDVFAVAVGSFDVSTLTATPKSFAIHTVDFKRTPPALRLAAPMPEAVSLNGLTTLSRAAQTVLAADSLTGNVFRVDLRSGASEVVLKDELTSPAPGGGLLAVDGIHIRKGTLYFSTAYRYLMGRVKINPDGTAAGPYEKVADTKLSDDFAFDARGNMYVTQESEVVKITPEGKTTHIVGSLNETVVAGATAAQFGRGKKDRDVLYVVTNGGLVQPVNGTYIEGGKVVAINLKGCL